MSPHLTGIKKLTVGKVIGLSDGSGFVRSLSDHPRKIHLSRSEIGEVLSGDKVSVQIVGRDRLGRLKGQIEDVLERAHKKMVGRYVEDVKPGETCRCLLRHSIWYAVRVDGRGGWGMVRPALGSESESESECPA